MCVSVWLDRMISRESLVIVIVSYSLWAWLDLGCILEYQNDKYDIYIYISYNMIIVSSYNRRGLYKLCKEVK